MKRIKFEKGSSQGIPKKGTRTSNEVTSSPSRSEGRPQREFLKLVLQRTNCPSLRELISRGFDIPYSTWKNYFNESRKLPEELFNDLCIFAKIDRSKLNINVLGSNWGQIKGGEISRK